MCEYCSSNVCELCGCELVDGVCPYQSEYRTYDVGLENTNLAEDE